MALRVSPSLISRMTLAFFEECDSDLAEQSLPANLKLIEGLLKNDPHNRKLLKALSMGFAGYTMLFIEDDDPERASDLYLRSKNYGIRAMGRKAGWLKDSALKKEIAQKRLMEYGEKDIEALFWTAVSWNAWINLNLHRTEALAQLGSAQACLERVMDLDPYYFHGVSYLVMGSILALMPGSLGGEADRARICFEKAMDISHGKFLLAHYYFAKYYAVRAQDKKLFLKLLKEIDTSSPDGLKEVCLINAVVKKKAKHLLDISEELFL
jgi:hypothetical protein